MTFEAPNPEYAEFVRTAVLSMPAAQHLGFDIANLAPGEAEIIQPYRRELTELNGFVQGGMIAALADFAGGSAAGTLLPAGWVNMTADCTVKLLAPARGETLLARGRVVRPGRVLTVAAVDVWSVEGGREVLCATALVATRNFELSRD